MSTPGDDVSSLLSCAQQSVLIVAPFIRSEPLTRVLDGIPTGVHITIVTRWRPADLLAGASDLDVFDITESLSIPLLLRHDLHAKLFAADDYCLVGSANVTNTALGWRTPANLELLTSVPRTAPDIVAFEKALLAGSVRATAEQRDQLRALVERLSEQPIIVIPEIADDETTPGLLLPNWVPCTMNPEELYLVYAGDIEDVNRTALTMMREELAQLGVAPGMSKTDFRAWVGAAIAQTPLVGGVMQRIDEDGQMTEPTLTQLLGDIGVDTVQYPPRSVIQVLERWLTHFLPTRYETAQDSIKLIKAKKV